MKFISHEQLQVWLASLAGSGALVAPVRLQEDLVLYQPVDPAQGVCLDCTRPTLSLKEFFLPATEPLLTIERVRRAQATGAGDWDVRLVEPPPGPAQVLFGVRPCDAHALLALDALLLQQPPVDAPYAQRRGQATLVGVACAALGPSCFCTSLDFTPDDPSGLDLMLYPVDGGYAVAGSLPDGSPTAKGAALIAGLNLPSYDGPRPWRDWSPPELNIPPRLAWTRLFEDPYWAQVADRCLSCKVCSYVCPTCRCFDVRDDTVAQAPGYQKIERLRCWDSCMAGGYRRIAGGHNPRPSTRERLRNRFYCKFDYYPAGFGALGCVGCGRCVDLCPVNVDITEVISDITDRGVQALAVD